MYNNTPGALNSESFPSPPLHAGGRSLLWEQVNNPYNKTRHSYIYMLRIAGQAAGPIGLSLFCGHSWVAGGDKGKNIFSQIFSSRATPGSSASIQNISLLLIDHTFYACLLINSWYYFHMFSPQQKILIIRCIFSLYTLYCK